MCLRIVVTCLLSVVLLVSRAGAAATVEERIAALQKRVDAIDVNVDTLTSSVEALSEKTEKLAIAKAKSDKQVKAIEDTIAELNAVVNALELKHDALAAGLHRELQAVNQTLSSISEDDGSGNAMLAVRNTMKSKKGRAQLSEAVHESLARQGTMRIRNMMPYEVQIRVNGVTYSVRAGVTLVINDLPVGTVTTELVGWEAPRNWTIAAPTYEQTIHIEPESTPRFQAPPLIGAPLPIEYRPW